MAKCFSKMYWNKGWPSTFNYQQSYVKMPVSTWCYIPTSLPPEHAAKTSMVSEVRSVWLILTYDWPCPITLEKHYTWWILRRWHIPNKPLFTRLATGLIVSNAWIQLKIVQHLWWFLRQWCRDVASGAERHLDIGLQVVEAHPLFPYF